ncbi:MAG: hypothetical protein OEV49_00890 [candidate division Zixibacteria bacterium]|nr:hypothetical protein [candidate division Zixibacteria bacterium]MDH3938379.1 hypothetical protein [candidate division Zixibacteria bacterium]
MPDLDPASILRFETWILAFARMTQKGMTVYSHAKHGLRRPPGKKLQV